MLISFHLFLLGGLIVPSGALGILVGGLILNKARFNRKGKRIVLFLIVYRFYLLNLCPMRLIFCRVLSELETWYTGDKKCLSQIPREYFNLLWLSCVTNHCW